jgi:hypothetical protein
VSADDVSPATAVELLGAADGLATSRRDRLSLARRTVPPAFLLLAFSSGVILSLNAVLLSLRIEGWAALAIMGLVVVTALDLALVVAVSEPYKGTIVVDPRPLADVVDDLDRGVFGPWGESPSGEDLGPA